MPTPIGWTDETWNIVTGCSKVSSGCANCYAERISLKNGWSKEKWTPQNAAQNVKLHPERLMKPTKVRKPTMWFVNSMSDWAHDLVPDEFILQMWQVMEACPQHVFQLLTKRPERMLAWCQKYRPNPAKNIWLGVSVENQKAADYRIPLLLETPAAIRFLSCEPLLEAVSIRKYLHGLHWVIVGGESGPNFRPMQKSWAVDILNQCREANVSFYGKQDAAYYSEVPLILNGEQIKEFPAMPEPDKTAVVAGEQLGLF
jgi:protein gp37